MATEKNTQALSSNFFVELFQSFIILEQTFFAHITSVGPQPKANSVCFLFQVHPSSLVNSSVTFQASASRGVLPADTASACVCLWVQSHLCTRLSMSTQTRMHTHTQTHACTHVCTYAQDDRFLHEQFQCQPWRGEGHACVRHDAGLPPAPRSFCPPEYVCASVIGWMREICASRRSCVLARFQ